jgi:23S rRNA pseudouridine955/2504/2580 synthase
MSIVPIKVSATEDGIKLSRFLSRHYPNANLILIRRLCRSGEIRVNSKRVEPGAMLRAGDLVRVPPALIEIRDTRYEIRPAAKFSLEDLEKLRQTIIYNDDDLVVFNKPAGLAVQGGGGIKKSLDKMAAALFPNDTISLVHRLDMETSGAIVVAKSVAAAQRLARDFQTRDVHKTYIAALAGGVRPTAGTITEPIDDKKAATRYEVLGELKNALTFVRFTPETGRKHQLRKHSAFALKAPIIGDALYGRRQTDAKLRAVITPGRLHLVARRISFRHPRTGKNLTISAPVPEWMKGPADLCGIEL